MNIRKASRLALAVSAALLLATTAEARTLYVNAKRPNNKGNGLKAATAKKTIQAAINIAKAGDTILVYPGTYAPIKTNNKKITIKSVKGQAKTKIVKPAATGIKIALAQLGKSYNVYLNTDYDTMATSGIWTTGAKSTLEGFLLDGLDRGLGSGGELIGVSGGTVKSCKIQRLGKKYARVVDSFGAFDNASVTVNSTLIDCKVLKNACNLAPAEWRAVSGKKSPSPTGSKLLRCTIQGNDLPNGFNASTLVNCLVTDNVVQYELFFEATLLNCTVAKNTAVGHWGDPSFSVSSKYTNCILWSNWVVPPKKIQTIYGWDYYDADGNYIGYRSMNQESFFVDADDIWGTYDNIEVTEATLANYYPGWGKYECSYTDTVPGTAKKLHNVDPGNAYKNTDKTNKNPKFISAYKLKKGSYAIDKGKLTKAQKKLVGTKDLAGKKRIRGKAIDRGCYEY